MSSFKVVVLENLVTNEAIDKMNYFKNNYKGVSLNKYWEFIDN